MAMLSMKSGLELCVRVDDLLVWFSAFHSGYCDLEFGVLFYSSYVEVGESAGGTDFGDSEEVQVFAVVDVFFYLDDWYYARATPNNTHRATARASDWFRSAHASIKLLVSL